MNSIGLTYLLKMGCVCGRETLRINDRRFIVRSRLGEGGFSYVDLIEDARTHRTYALKRITCHSKDEERTAMQEVELMKTFKHTNLIPLEASSMKQVDKYTKTLDIISEVLIVMPCYSRGSTQDIIERMAKKGEKLQEDKIWEIFLGLCQGLKVLHKHNPPYAHRDIKPGNVMLSNDGQAVLMDLGSAAKARVEISTPSIGRALQDEAAERCSMLYRAPELFNAEVGTTVDERTDIWSLGCTLYALAFLESPFDRAYQRGDSIALAVLSGNVKFPENSGYSGGIQETILRLMKPSAAERPFIDEVLQLVQTNSYSSGNRV
ncbi:serine/threonine-protein kinase 16-like [Argopecten irradians]|uniref:serine/threonine-protein kinase 16-like n=1 Tax=Argopecten irradians TaxID=31199 RepID=UPI00371A2FD6